MWADCGDPTNVHTRHGLNVHIRLVEGAECAHHRGSHPLCERSVLGFDHYRVVCSLGLQVVRELFQEQFAVLDTLA